MKTKNFKRVMTVVLALAMMLSLSMVAFADGDPDGSVEVRVRFANYNLVTHNYSYSAGSPIPLVDLYEEDSVYDVLDRAFGADATWNVASGHHYLESIEIDNVVYEDIRVEAAASCYNYDDEYIGGNAIIDSLNQLDEFDACDGVYMSMYMLMEEDGWKGYYIMGDMQHMCAITYDWKYEVSTDGGVTFFEPLNNANKLATLDEHEPVDGEIIRITYGLVWEIFDPAES